MPQSVLCPITQHYVRHHINTNTGQTYELKAFAEYCCQFSNRFAIVDLNRERITSIHFSYQLQQIIDHENEEYEKTIAKKDEKGEHIESALYESYDRSLYLKALETYFDSHSPNIRFAMPTEDAQSKNDIALQTITAINIQSPLSVINDSLDEAQPLIRRNQITSPHNTLATITKVITPVTGLLKGCTLGFFESFVGSHEYHLGYKGGKSSAQFTLNTTKIYNNINKPSHAWLLNNNLAFSSTFGTVALISLIEAGTIYSLAYMSAKKKSCCYASILFMSIAIITAADILLSFMNESGSYKCGEWQGYETQWQASCKELNITMNCNGNVTGPNQNDYDSPLFARDKFLASNGILLINIVLILLISACGYLQGYFARQQRSRENEIISLNNNHREVDVDLHRAAEPNSSLRAR